MTKYASTIHRLIESLEDVAGAMHRMTFVDDAGNEAGVTYRRFAEAVFHQAGALRELGVRENDLVMLALPASVEHAVAMMACVMTGALPCTVPVPARRAAAGRQVIDGQADDGSLDDRQVTEAVGPGGPVGQYRM